MRLSICTTQINAFVYFYSSDIRVCPFVQFKSTRLPICITQIYAFVHLYNSDICVCPFVQLRSVYPYTNVLDVHVISKSFVYMKPFYFMHSYIFRFHMISRATRGHLFGNIDEDRTCKRF